MENKIEVDGKVYKIDKTFDGNPAIYKITEKGKIQHISGGHEYVTEFVTLLKEGTIVIVAEEQ